MAGAGSIFLNYRREETQWVAGRLHDRLAAVFGRDRIFTDVDSIGPGQDFTKVLEDAVGNCRVLLAIIGRNWTDALDEAGRRRLENPHDWVRFEIESALSRKGVLVIPVLTDNAPMPRAEELPGELAQLSMRQAVKISADGFARDVEDLIDYLKKIIDPPAAQQPPLTQPPQQQPLHHPQGTPYRPPPVVPASSPGTPPIAVAGYPALPDDLQWSAKVTGSVVVERVAVSDGSWVKIGDPLFVLRTSTGLVTLWSTYIGQVQALAYRKGQHLVPGQPLLTLAVSGWLFRPNARMPFDTGVLLASGAPSRRFDAAGTASRLLVMVNHAGSRPVPWNTNCLIYVPDGSHLFSAIYELKGSPMATANETVKIRRGRPVALAYEPPRTVGASGKLRS
jgi:biotin carboxyl carrier protein